MLLSLISKRKIVRINDKILQHKIGVSECFKDNTVILDNRKRNAEETDASSSNTSQDFDKPG